MTSEEILRKTDEWHKGQGENKTLAEYLGMTPYQYRRYVEHGEIPRSEDPDEQTSEYLNDR